MKTNYKVLFCTFIINIFMALSLNSFSSSSMYRPVLFLYFLSNLAAFLDKITFYQDMKMQFEKYISITCFSLCILNICLYLAHSLDFIEIKFQPKCLTYRILIQGIQNCFFTFNSIDITWFIFISVFTIPFSYLFICIVSFLRECGYTKYWILKITREHKKELALFLVPSVLFGLGGIALCRARYLMTYAGYGNPQYCKYFMLLFIFSFIGLYILFLRYNKKLIKNS